MTSFFWSILLLVATSATARKEFIYDVILLETGRNKSGSQQVLLSDFESSLPLLGTGLNHVKICLSSWFHIMPKLLLHSYFQHIVI